MGPNLLSCFWKLFDVSESSFLGKKLLIELTIFGHNGFGSFRCGNCPISLLLQQFYCLWRKIFHLINLSLSWKSLYEISRYSKKSWEPFNFVLVGALVPQFSDCQLSDCCINFQVSNFLLEGSFASFLLKKNGKEVFNKSSFPDRPIFMILIRNWKVSIL